MEILVVLEPNVIASLICKFTEGEDTGVFTAE